MPEIRLVRGVWQYDEQSRLGRPGGFGEVFRGSGEGNEVAIKRLSLTATAAAHREMKIAGSLVDREHQHIVPILDYGQDLEVPIGIFWSCQCATATWRITLGRLVR